MKAHIALHHAVQICVDANLEHDEEDSVDHGEFFKQLDLVSRVISLLESQRYVLMPACDIWRVMERERLKEDASEKEKALQFLDFLQEAKEAFRKYHILFLRGISVPSSYDDLLPVADTTYKDVCWKGTDPPRSNTFSAKGYVTVSEDSQPSSKEKEKAAYIVKKYNELL